MMKHCILVLFTILLCTQLYAQQDSINIYNQRGEEQTIEDIFQALNGKTHVFYGELHGVAGAQRMELRLLQACDSLFSGRVTLGMEMFEADVQPIVDEYLNDIINKRSFENEARIWTNYDRDYRPLVAYAKEKNIKVVASNIPRRYANMVYHRGAAALDSLTDWAQAFVAPLPLHIDTNLRSYQEISVMAQGHNPENMVTSQAVKDATMAHFILKHTQPDYLFFHINGAYHSDFREGIVYYLQKEIVPEHILTITTVKAKDFDKDKASALAKADFVVVVD